MIRQPLPDKQARVRRQWPPCLIVNAVFYVVRTGCSWQMLPDNFGVWPPIIAA